MTFGPGWWHQPGPKVSLYKPHLAVFISVSSISPPMTPPGCPDAVAATLPCRRRALAPSSPSPSPPPSPRAVPLPQTHPTPLLVAAPVAAPVASPSPSPPRSRRRPTPLPCRELAVDAPPHAPALPRRCAPPRAPPRSVRPGLAIYDIC